MTNHAALSTLHSALSTVLYLPIMPAHTDRKSKLATLAVCCAAFLGFGLFTAALGPNLPEMAAMTANSLATLGAVFTALYLGAILAQIAYGPLDDRFGERPLMLVGLALAVLGSVGLTISHALPLTLAAGFVIGLGGGTIITSANLLVAEAYVERRVSALNVLNLFFGVGAIAGPALAGLLIRTWGTALPALWVGAAVFLLLLPFVVLIPAAHSAPHAPHSSKNVSVYRAPLLWVMGVLLLVYVGTEAGVGGWTLTYMERTTILDREAASWVASGFWFGFTLGRIVAAVIGARLTAVTLLLASAVGSLVAGLLLVGSGGNAGFTIVATVTLGFCFGPIYPTALAITTAAFANAPGRAVSVIAALGSAGGMLLPPLQGVLLEGVSPLASVMQVAAATLGMLGLGLGVRALLLGRMKDKVTHNAELDVV